LLTVAFSISAILAGFGRPLLISSAKEAKADFDDRVGGDNIATINSQLEKLWRGTNSVPSASPSPMSKTKPPEKSYPSWIWWKIAIFFWLATIIYTPFAFADESKEAMKYALKMLEKKRRQIRNNPAVVLPSGTAPTSTAATVFGTGFWRLLKIDVIAEYIPALIRLIVRKLSQ
jgi:hypothetical protein